MTGARSRGLGIEEDGESSCHFSWVWVTLAFSFHTTLIPHLEVEAGSMQDYVHWCSGVEARGKRQPSWFGSLSTNIKHAGGFQTEASGE